MVPVAPRRTGACVQSRGFPRVGELSHDGSCSAKTVPQGSNRLRKNA